MPNPAISVQPIHFEDFDGSQFERLVFAYHTRGEHWKSLEWYGQTGSDLGRDIWGVHGDGETVCIQCVNRSNLTFAKVRDDLSKVLRASNGVPNRFRIILRANVSAAMRDKIKTHVSLAGVADCDIWSGKEFEEHLRREAESLLKRFVEGEAFPDTESELKNFAEMDGIVCDDDILVAMSRLFDRPAFYTPIHQESNLPDFKQAITDTIQALGTGIWKARDGQTIARIPSRHQFKDANLRKEIQGVEIALAKLRAKFDDLLKEGAIRPCGCTQPDCPTFMMSPAAARELDRLRAEALTQFRHVYPAFNGRPGW
jgi:hypothetical protein